MVAVHARGSNRPNYLAISSGWPLREVVEAQQASARASRRARVAMGIEEPTSLETIHEGEFMQPTTRPNYLMMSRPSCSSCKAQGGAGVGDNGFTLSLDGLVLIFLSAAGGYWLGKRS